MKSLLPEISPPGFVFENVQRNTFLEKTKGYVAPTATKTGTTIVGIIFKDGVILAADTRATSDTIVADKNCAKIHYVAKNMYCCGAGTAADTEVVTRMLSSHVELHRLNTGREVAVVTGNRFLKQMLFRYQGNIGAALILGGVDRDGPHLYCIYPHGSTDQLQYTTMGSGSLAAMSVLESAWKPNLGEEEGKKLVRDAIAGGIFNDLGSGNSINMCVIKKGSVEYIRPYEEACVKGTRSGTYIYKPGTTPILTTTVTPIPRYYIEHEQVRHIDPESMDTSS